MTLVERGVDLDPVVARIVRVGFAAAKARRTSLDTPAAAVVPKSDAAVRLGLRALAAERVQAVAERLFLAAELVDELAVLEVTATLAVVMNRLTEDALGLAFGVEAKRADHSRDVASNESFLAAHHENLDEHRHQPFGVSRATGDVHDRRCNAALLQEVRNTRCIRGVRISGHPATVDGAGTERDDCSSIARSLGQDVLARLHGHAQRVAAEALGDATLVNDDVATSFDGLLLGFLDGMACTCAQNVAVVQRDELEHDLAHVGGLDLRERLRATRAGCALDP